MFFSRLIPCCLGFAWEFRSKNVFWSCYMCYSGRFVLVLLVFDGFCSFRSISITWMSSAWKTFQMWAVERRVLDLWCRRETRIDSDRLGSTRIDSDRPDQLNMFPLQFEGDKEIPKEDNFFCCTDLAKILGLGIAFSIFALKAGKTGNC